MQTQGRCSGIFPVATIFVLFVAAGSELFDGIIQSGKVLVEMGTCQALRYRELPTTDCNMCVSLFGIRRS